MHDSIETIGSIETSESVKRQLAESSSTFNGEDAIFCHLFPKVCGRKVTDSEDSSSESSPSKNPKAFADTIPPVREKALPHTTQYPTLPPIDLTLAPSEITSLSPLEETLVSQDTLSPTSSKRKTIELEEIPADKGFPNATYSQRKLPFPEKMIHRQILSPETIVSTVREKIPSPDEIIKTSGKEPSGTIQEQRTITHPPHTTPSVDMPKNTRRWIPDTISPAGEKTEFHDEISPPPRTQPPISTEITLSPTHLTPVLIKITPSSPPEETTRPDETFRSKKTVFSRIEFLSPQIIQNNRKEFTMPSETIQEQRSNAVPPHTTPSVTRPMLYSVRYADGKTSSNEVKPSQNVSLRPFIRSPFYPKHQNLGKNPETLESIKVEERHSPPIGPSETTYSDRNLPSTSKRIISQQTLSLEREICPDIKQMHPSIDVITPVGGEIRHQQEEYKSQRNTRINSMIGVFVVLILALGLLLIALLFTLVQ